MIKLEHVDKYFGDLHVLKDVNLEVAEGEKLVIIGPSGSGKSTTVRCMNFLEEPTSGHVYIDGQELTNKNKTRIVRDNMSMVFQQFNLVDRMSVLRNVMLGALSRTALWRSLLGFFHEEDARLAYKALARVGIMEKAHQRTSNLSGGQQQRCALARILASEPTAILLDEPFSALDSYLKYQLELELAETLGGFPGTVLWVSHDRGEVFRNCRRVCVIDRGRSQPVTTLGELFRSPGTEAAARLSGCKNYADARPREDAVFLPDWGLTLSCGRPVPEGVCRIGIRAHHVQLAGPGAENAFSCTAVKVVEDVFSTIVLLRPEGAAPEAPLLRMELDKDNWQAVPDKDRLTVSVPPEAILLLES